MTEAKIVTGKRGHVWCIGFNRPAKYNAFDVDMYHQLAAAYGELDADPELRCALLHANGEHFTSGLDLPKWAPAFGSGRFPDLPDGHRDPFALDPVHRVSKPVVVAAQGICFTVGIELMLAADIRVCADNTRFGQIEVKRGIYPVGGATLRMVQEFGWGNAQRYLLTGDEFDAAEALRIGLVQEVVPSGKQFERGLELAGRIAQQAPLGVRASLRSSRLAVERGTLAALANLLPDLLPLMKSEDVQEGIKSFIERREARFTGR
jgi:enoyl-CoA hydratase